MAARKPKARKSKLYAMAAATLAGLGGLAAFLANIDTVVSKPAEIAAKAGVLKPRPVAVHVELADLDDAATARLVFGGETIEGMVSFQRYALVDGVYCIPRSSIGNCPGAEPAVLLGGQTIDEYYSEDSFRGPFGPAIPIFDISSVRPDERDILLVSQRLEFERLAVDTTPYVEVMGLDDDEGRLLIVNHSTQEIDSLTLHLRLGDVITTSSTEAWIKAHPRVAQVVTANELITLRNGPLFAKREPGLDDFVTQKVDLRPAILRRIPSAEFRPYPGRQGEEGEQPSEGLVGAQLTWLEKPLNQLEDWEAESAKQNLAVMAAGQLSVRSRAGKTYSTHFVAPIIVSSEKGYGAAGVSVDSSVVYLVDDRLAKGSVSKRVKLALNDGNPTIRTQAAVLFKQSGRYRLRFVYASLDNPSYMASDWVTVQAFASPNFVQSYFAMSTPD